MNEQQSALWAIIQEKQSEVKELRNQLDDLLKEEKEVNLTEKYLGKYYFQSQYKDTFKTYIYVNDLKNARLNCVLLRIVYDETTNEVSSVTCDSQWDFSCHYLQDYDSEPSINECTEITKEEFLKANEIFLLNYIKNVK